MILKIAADQAVLCVRGLSKFQALENLKSFIIFSLDDNLIFLITPYYLLLITPQWFNNKYFNIQKLQHYMK